MRRAFPWSREKESPDRVPSAEKVYVKGEKTVLREKRVEDAPDDYAWRTDEELARLDATRPLNMSYEDFLRYSKEEISFASPLSKRLAIDTLDGKHIGNCMYYDIDVKGGEAELGVMIGDRDYWGKGYGPDSVDTLLTHIFTTSSLRCIYLHTLEWNHRARRSFARSGFAERKIVRRGGMDFVRMEIRREDWERRRDSRKADEEPSLVPQADRADGGAKR